jgi:hypothetical protein
MKINPVPLLFVPGIALASYLVGGWECTFAALIAWVVLVTAATFCSWMRVPATAQQRASAGADSGEMIDGIHFGRTRV